MSDEMKARIEKHRQDDAELRRLLVEAGAEVGEPDARTDEELARAFEAGDRLMARMKARQLAR